MDFKRKRFLKKRGNILSYISYMFLAIFFIEFVLIFARVFTIPNLKEHGIELPVWLALVILLTPLFLVPVFQILSVSYYNTLGMYKAGIKEYRKRKMFIRILDLVRDKEYTTAIDLYNKLKESPEKDYIYMHIITTYLNSDDPKLVKKGNEWMDNFRKTYDYNETIKKLPK